MPFFSAGFVGNAAGLATSLKTNSRAAFQTLALLDDDLAKIPLDNGIVPASRTGRLLRTKISELSSLTKKAASKAFRHVSGGHHPTVGSQLVVQQWHQYELYRELPLHKLALTGLFDQQYLEEVGRGNVFPDRPTLGFLILLGNMPTRE